MYPTCGIQPDEHYNIIGSRTGYYRVFRGEKYLTEEQQKEIMEYFQSRGHVNTSLFYGYIEEYNA